MTIALSQEQERAIRDAIADGQIASVEEFIDTPSRGAANIMSAGTLDQRANPPSNKASAYSAVRKTPHLLDEVVSRAYQERRRRSQAGRAALI